MGLADHMHQAAKATDVATAAMRRQNAAQARALADEIRRGQTPELIKVLREHLGLEK